MRRHLFGIISSIWAFVPDMLYKVAAAYSRSGRMSDVYSWAVASFIRCLTFGKFQTIGIILCLVMQICPFQFKWLSTWRPRYLIEFENRTGRPFIWTLFRIVVSVLLERRITDVLSVFILSRLFVYQFMTRGSFSFVFAIADVGLSPDSSIIQSSANK